MIGCDRMNFSSLIFGFAVLGGTAPSAFAQTKRLPPVIRERRGLKDTKFGNTAQFIKQENTLPLKEDKSGFLKSDAGYGPHGSHMSGPHHPEMSYDFDYDYPPGGGGDEPHGYGPHGSHMSGPHYPEMSYNYDYDYDYYEPDTPPMSNEEASIIGEIVSHCQEEVMALDQCYGGDEDRLGGCFNCIFAGFQVTDFSCEELDVDYERCGDVCVAQCDEAIRGLYQCGKVYLPCDDVYGSPEMTTPPTSEMTTPPTPAPSQGVYLAEE